MMMILLCVAAVVIVGGLGLLKFFVSLYCQRVRKVIVGDITIAYRQYGSGDPVVFIAGYGSSMAVWRKAFFGPIASKYRVIVFDNRGVGQTTVGTKEYTVQQCAQDTKGLLDQLKISKAHIFGYSMGSLIAQEFVFQYPSMVKKLILGGPNALGASQMAPRIQHFLADLRGSDAVLWRRRLRLIFPQEWLKEHSYLLHVPASFNRDIMKRQLDAMQEWHGTAKRLELIKNQTLILVGKKDIITPPGNALFMMQYISGAWLVQVEGAGHGLVNQYPHKAAAVIRAFLLT